MARGKKIESTLTPEEKLVQALVLDGEQPYKVPKNWCWTKIGAVSDFERGITFPASAKESEVSEENIPCLRTANVQENLEIDDLIYVNRGFMKSNEAKLVRENDIIMSSANSRELVGKVSFVTHVPFPMTFGGFVLNIRAKGISSKYLFYFLRREFLAGKFMGESTQTTNIANINTTTLGNYELPLPPLAEQQRIVDRIESMFTKLDEAKEKAQSVLDSFETRKAAILHKAFTGELTAKWRAEHDLEKEEWRRECIKDICAKITDGTHHSPPNTDDGEYMYVTAKNIKEYGVDLSNITYVTKEVHEEIFSRCDVRFEDVLYIKDGATTGIATVNTIVEPFSLLSSVAVLRPLSGIVDPYYMAYNLNSFETKAMMINNMSGNAITRLTLAKIKNAQLTICSIDEQQEIVRILDSLFTKEQQVKDAAEAVLGQINLMKKSILARAFRGELGTNDTSEESSVELIKQLLSEKIPEDRTRAKRVEKKPEVKFVAKTIMQALSAGTKITPEMLKSETGLLIDDFYDQLKVLIDSGQVIETRIDGESYLEAKYEDRQPNN